MWEWFAEVAFTRLMLVAPVSTLRRGWSDDDLAARVIASSDEWTVLRLPAIAEEHDPLGREPGAALWPSAYPIAPAREDSRSPRFALVCGALSAEPDASRRHDGQGRVA